ncbi:MAG: mechanosensitive ion channel [Campylobacterales bacterium]|nr:mechanosensitive ion channel [Campylobacterales bacterium]
MNFWFKLLLILALGFSFADAKPKKLSGAEETAQLDQNISFARSQISQIDESLAKNIWYKRYKDFKEYGNYKKSIFGELIKVDSFGNPPKVESPFGIFSALSFIKESSVKKDIYESRLNELNQLNDVIVKRDGISKNLANLLELRGDEEAVKLNSFNDEETSAIKRLKVEKESFAKSVEAFNEKTVEDSQKLQMDIKYQLTKLLNIVLLILGVVVVSMLIKRAIKKYSAANHEKAYLFAKTVNIVTILFVVLILLFSYINDVGYLVTILGFASAGIAIAMKDWFMSLMGWVAIVLGGVVKVGDRVKISSKEGVETLGDVIDISLLTITLYEDVSLISYEKSKRAGRIVFVPNNYIFTHIFLNYSHSGLSTVWDCVDIRITFDSDVSEAVRLAKEIAEKNTRTYSRLTDRSIRRMRAKYSIGDVSTDPRVFSFVENNGVAISVWYLAHSFAILKTKSQMSKDLIDALNASDKVKIAFPTTSVLISEDSRKHA